MKTVMHLIVALILFAAAPAYGKETDLEGVVSDIAWIAQQDAPMEELSDTLQSRGWFIPTRESFDYKVATVELLRRQEVPPGEITYEYRQNTETGKFSAMVRAWIPQHEVEPARIGALYAALEDRFGAPDKAVDYGFRQ